ncbi:hypothetical protein SAY87_016665 [Trapa incisa]|uniref:Uncharacterized protein n=1 Tax=Trapa incisa TaxID=236973 RepID=A0AAN7QUJ4_9MYRT|nr:hypothetical protein SAY87_016665 [Trapa incisa]
MAYFGKLGIGLSIIFGCLVLALGAEVYYLLWWKKKTAINPSSQETVESAAGYSFYAAKELLIQLICWKKKPSSDQQHRSGGDRIHDSKVGEDDPELAAGDGSIIKHQQFAGDEESVELELMRLHNLAGPPRFLFTITEETREDLESHDERSRKGSRGRSLSDLILSSVDTPFRTPLPSPTMKTALSVSLEGSNRPHLVDSYNNPLFESSAATGGRPPSSPPPKFKFLRDAEEKLYRRIKEESEARLREVQQREEATVPPPPTSGSSQVLPLESSPTSLRPTQDKKAVIC